MEMREHWNRLADVWERRHALSAGYHDPHAGVALEAVPFDDATTILDIGCGIGVTAVEIARRAGPNARVTGIDLSPAMINHAGHRNHAAIMNGDITPDNITFRVADAQRDDLGDDHDVVFSRFGVMFFDDPPSAFANIASSLKTRGWLSFVAWADEASNPWMPLPNTAAATRLGVTLDPPPAPGAPGPFSLADAAATAALLTDSGFDEPDIIDITQPRRVDHDTARLNIAFSLQVGPLADAFDAADEPTRQAAIDDVLAAMEPYHQSGPAGGWLIPSHSRAYLTRKR